MSRFDEITDKLAFEAGCTRYSYWDPKHPECSGFIISQEVLDQYTRLIVKECVDIADQEAKSQKNAHGRVAADRIWSSIKNTFGL